MSSCPSLPTGPRKPCVVTYYTQVDKSSSSEPPPQPRVRKVTTVINSLAVVIRDSPTHLGVWVLTACQEKILPKTQPHLFLHYRLGTWLTVGVYPDGTVASFSPWSFVLSAYPMSLDKASNQLFLKIKASEFQYEKTITYKEFIETHLDTSSTQYENERSSAHLFIVPGFGLVLAHEDFLQKQKDEGENLAAWIQWCGDASRGCCWMVNSLSNNVEEKFSERDLKEAAEVVKCREAPTDVQLPSQRVVARHFGLITDVNVQKNLVIVWSPNVSLEYDHHAKVPLPPKRDVDSSLLPPLIGQWVQFDIQANDIKEFVSTKTGCRLTIPEYLPITSPAGVGVAHSNRVVRIMVSSILVKGTTHPNLFELPHFGFVLDRKATLISGVHMQLVLEKTSHRIRRTCGVCWVVIDSVQIDPNNVAVEALQGMMVYLVPLKDAMDVSVIVPVEKQIHQPKEVFNSIKQCVQPPSVSPNFNTGVTNLKYQPPHEIHYLETRRDYYGSARFSNDNHFQKKRGSQYSGATMEGTGLVEKIQIKAGVFWMFEGKTFAPDGSEVFNRAVPGTVHFIFEEPFDLVMGDYVRVKLVQKADPEAINGYRWFFVNASKKQAPFPIHSGKYNVVIREVLTPAGVDRYKRQTYQCKWFSNILDTMNFLQTVPTTSFYANITRRRVQVPNDDQAFFSWIIANSAICPAPQTQYPTSRTFVPRFNNNSRGYRNQDASRLENSSPSPPLKAITVSDE